MIVVLEDWSSLHAVMLLSTVCPTPLLLGKGTRGLDLGKVSIAHPQEGGGEAGMQLIGAMKEFP